MKRKTYRVVQWGTGNVGKHALRGIVTRPDYELVGLKVYSDDKAGRDAGELVGESDTGILATTSVDEILAIDADCVNYNALGTTEDMYGPPLDDICMLLSRGYNVTTTAIDAFVYPPSAPAEYVQRLEEACAAGGTSFFGSGIDPGFTHDFFPITLTRLSRQVDRIRALEVLNMRDYTSAERDATSWALVSCRRRRRSSTPMHSEPENSVFYTCMLMVADALRLRDRGLSLRARGRRSTEVPVEIALGTIEPGTIAAVKIVMLPSPRAETSCSSSGCGG